jgi:hypothetical protein
MKTITQKGAPLFVLFNKHYRITKSRRIKLVVNAQALGDDKCTQRSSWKSKRKKPHLKI